MKQGDYRGETGCFKPMFTGVLTAVEPGCLQGWKRVFIGVKWGVLDLCLQGFLEG